MTKSDGGRRIPADSFRIRLAIVRTAMGWNYEDAAAATGIGAESWRTWEKGLRHCTDVIGVSRRISEVTPYDQAWLVFGGPLAEDDTDPLHRRPRRKAAAGASTNQVSSASNRGCMSATRCDDAEYVLSGNYAAA
jgi:transcriptional regulator with XRE-family HTH domain